MTNYADARAAIAALCNPHGRVSFNTKGCTAGQVNALAGIAGFLPHPTKRTFLMCGAAGTGKTQPPWRRCAAASPPASRRS